MPSASYTEFNDFGLRDEGEALAARLRTRPCTAVHGFWRRQTTQIARDTVREAGTAVRQALG